MGVYYKQRHTLKKIEMSMIMQLAVKSAYIFYLARFLHKLSILIV